MIRFWGLGLFIENGADFTSSAESGFIFDSSVSPSASTFGATLFDGTTGSGHVQAPVVVPEASSLALCAFGLAALLRAEDLFASRPVRSNNPFNKELESMNYSIHRLTSVLGAFSLLCGQMFASSHSDAPLSKQDPQ